MRKVLLIVIVLISIRCFGQKTTRENDDSLLLKEQMLLMPKSGSSSRNDEQSSYTISNHEFNNADRFKIRESYYLPLLSAYQRDSFFTKFLMDENLTNQFKIDDFGSITTSHIQTNLIGLGGVNLVMGSYNYNILDVGVISSGIYAAKYNIYNDFLNDVGFNGNIKIHLSDRIDFNLFGQYSIRESKIAISPFISPLYPHSNYGGSVEFKVNANWGLMMGAENEYDVFLRKWVTRPFIMPVFYK